MPKQNINPIYEFGDQVYLTSDPMQYLYIVVAYQIDPNGLRYLIRNGADKPILAVAFELSTKRYEFVKSDVFPTED